MSVKLRVFALFTCLILVFVSQKILGQQTELYRSDLVQYYNALDLMGRQHYEPARKAFDAFIREDGDKFGEYNVNAQYYRALSSLKLFHKDAEFLMEQFILGYPESIWKQDAVLDLARYNFNRRDYDDALRWFEELDKRDLSPDLADEVTFKTGFSAFEEENFEKAKSAFYDLKDKETVYKGPSNYYYGHMAYEDGNYQTALESFRKAQDDPNFSKVVPYYIAHIYHFQEKYDELIDYASPLMESEKLQREEEISLLIGNAYYLREDYSEAIPFLEKYMAKQYNPNPEQAYRMAYAYYRTGDYQKSIDFFAKASKDEGELGQIATYQMADAYLNVGQKEYARNAFKVAAQMNFDKEVTEDALFNYAKLAYELSYDPFHEAIIAFEQYLKNYPSSTRKDEAFEFLLKVHLATKNYEAALSAIDQIKTPDPIQKGQYQSAALNLGIELMNKKQNDEALKKFELAKRYDNNPQTTALADYWSGDVYYRMSKYSDAKSSYNAFLNNSSAYSTKYYNLANYNVGYCSFKDGSYGNALTAFRKYVSSSDKDPKRRNDAYLRIGDLHLVDKNYSEAIEAYQSALSEESLNEDYALFQQSMAHGYRDDYPKKISTLQKLLKEHPETSLASVAYFELGTAHFLRNELEAASAAFGTVIEDYAQSPYRKKALLQLGLVEYRRGEYDRAISSIKQVVDDYGVDAESQEAIATLKNIYLDLGRVDEYSAWLNGLENYEVSPGEIDSLTYQSAENLVAEGNCDEGIPAFEKYLREFPNGLFALHANYYLGDCAYRKNDYEKALPAFEFIALSPAGQFTEPALLGAASIRFKRGEFQEALGHFQKLEQAAEFPLNRYQSVIGQMRSHYELGNYEMAFQSIEKVLKDENLTDQIESEARLLRARMHFTERDFSTATSDYEWLAAIKETESGAEAQFRLAQIAYANDDYDRSERLVFDLVKEFSAYPYWKVKGFILLADVYAAKEDFFQAKSTLESVIQNVTDSALVKEAKAKLEMINAEEDAFIARGDTIQPPDTLDFEDEYDELIDGN